MRTIVVLLGILFCAQAQAQAQAAALRAMTTLHGPDVYLRDLFKDAGPDANRLLGPGPVPGGRIIVEAPQLNAIAREYGVKWRSVSPADRAVLEWPGRQLDRKQVLEAVKAAVAAAGSSGDVDIELSGFDPPTVPADTVASLIVSQVEYNSDTGVFTAALNVSGPGMKPLDIPVGGVVHAMTEVPVAVTQLFPGTVLRAGDVRIARIRSELVHHGVARSDEQIVGMELRQPAVAGQPLRLSDLVRPPLVQRGRMVQIEMSSPGLEVTGRALALDAGAEGDRIRVQNLVSHAYLFARVVGPDQVVVTPDDAPSLTALPNLYARRIPQ